MVASSILAANAGVTQEVETVVPDEELEDREPIRLAPFPSSAENQRKISTVCGERDIKLTPAMIRMRKLL